ncbi:MAG: TolC family protein [Pseudomonadota bacterium]
MLSQKKVYIRAVYLIFFSLLLFVPAQIIAQEKSKGLSIIDAIKTTLSHQPSIKIQEEEVQISKGALQQTQGQFDPTIIADINRTRNSTPLTAADRALYGRSKDVENLTTYTMSLSKKLRNGITIKPNLQMTRNDDLSFGAQTTNKSSVNFALIFPLLKGSGKEAAGAEEMSAKIRLQASERDLRHTVSASVLETGNAYWTLLAAFMNLKILKETESRAQQLLEDVEKLVEADERPSSDLDQLRANLASKTGNRIQGEQNLYENYQQLGIAMGLQYSKIIELPTPADIFPELLSEKKLSIISQREKFFQISTENRADLIALKKLQESARILLSAARLNMRPQLDLSFSMGYQGLEESDSESGYYDAFQENVRGLNGSAMISLVYPFGNNAPKGLYYQRKSSYQQARIRSTDLERNIHSDVAIAINALIQRTKELQESQKSVASYKKALENEKFKLKIGLSTVIDVVGIEDKYRNALLTDVVSHRQYAGALLQLRFATGTLLHEYNGEYTITMEQLAEIPDYKQNR